MSGSELSTQMLDPRVLRKNPWNSNVVSPDNEAKLDESVRRLGMFKPVVVRTLEDGSLQILGGEHRAQSAIRIGMTEIPVVNLGKIDDTKAKEIGLIDNGRYGVDDAFQLAELMSQLGTPEELASFMPYSDADLASIFATVEIALDEIDLPDDAPAPPSLAESLPMPKTHSILRFKVPIDDVDEISAKIDKVMKRHGFTESDSLTNAGDALVYMLKGFKE